MGLGELALPEDINHATDHEKRGYLQDGFLPPPSLNRRPKQNHVHCSELELLLVLAVSDGQGVLEDLPRVDGYVRKVSTCDLVLNKGTRVFG